MKRKPSFNQPDQTQNLIKTRKGYNPYFVITGGPGVGKTTLLQEFKKRGMPTIPEIARELIKEQQAIDGEALPWKNKKQYMELMFQRSIESFERVTTDFQGTDPVFFDRGFLDALCYAALKGIPIAQEMKTFSETNRYNNNVFISCPRGRTFTRPMHNANRTGTRRCSPITR